MNNAAKNKALQQEAKQKNKAIQQRYRDRLSVLRQAQEYSLKDDIPRAVTAYNKYIDSLCAYFEIEEKQLKPDILMKENNLAEVLLISQVYWDLAKAYDRSPKLVKECERCLDMFVKFSTGFKFQFINSEMLRKYIKKKSAYNLKSFQASYDKIRVSSKNCYIATYCYGNDHEVTQTLRQFKFKILNKSKLGNLFIELYYRFSPKVVQYHESMQPISNLSTKFIIRPLLFGFSFILKRFIIK